ncbi:MAG: hypothetical protein J7L38_04125 [Thermoproteales archaeon]|nr:hypothetical protein [Thermoproteales archaeon]RLE67276.1 MAG: hypothetical protein DRJ47_00190 [Thermoprotei archaeon]
MVIYVIEHLEPVVSKWVWFEYKNVSHIVGKENLVISNIRDPAERKLLTKIAFMVLEESILSLKSFKQEDMIVLDPQAPHVLEPKDVKENTVFVIGGIMGDHPPKGRTKTFLSKRLPNARKRNLGKLQLSVDGAAYVAKRIAEGTPLSELFFVNELEIKVSEKHSIILPFSYPIKDGRPLISRELVEYLKNGIDRDEAEYLKLGRVKSVVEFDENGL